MYWHVDGERQWLSWIDNLQTTPQLPYQTDNPIKTNKSGKSNSDRKSNNHCTWYLLVELNGISQTFLLVLRNSSTCPIDSSTHLSSADSEASPLQSLDQMPTFRVRRPENMLQHCVFKWQNDCITRLLHWFFSLTPELISFPRRNLNFKIYILKCQSLIPVNVVINNWY